MRWWTLLFAHAIASWMTLGVVWTYTLAQANLPPLDRQFWVIFLVTEGAAPIWLPVSLFIYSPAPTYEVLEMMGIYLVTAVVAHAILVRLARRRLGRRRLAAGLCPCCGYDVRATPAQCPECGTPNPSAAAVGLAR